MFFLNFAMHRILMVNFFLFANIILVLLNCFDMGEERLRDKKKSYFMTVLIIS